VINTISGMGQIIFFSPLTSAQWITTEKVLQFVMPLRSIYNENIVFVEQILFSLNKYCILEHYLRVQAIKDLLICIIFAMKIFFW